MKEFPEKFPDLQTFVKVSEVVRQGEVFDNKIKKQFVNQVETLFTPDYLLEQTEFQKPAVVTPLHFPTFDSLLAAREKIRLLQLVPVKDESEYQYYHAQPKEAMIARIQQYIADVPLAIERNEYPYFLPDDLEQYILWMQDPQTDKRQVAETVAGFMESQELGLQDIIIFERPLRSKSYLVRGTVPEVRHMHVWLRGRKMY